MRLGHLKSKAFNTYFILLNPSDYSKFIQLNDHVRVPIPDFRKKRNESSNSIT